MSLRRKVVVAVLLAGVVALAGWLGSLQSRGDPEGPAGTLAFERLLAGYGLDVAEADRPRQGATFVLFDDLRSGDEAEVVVDWVRRGGRLLIADPRSATASALGIEPAGLVGGTLSATAELATDCLARELAGVESVVVRPTDLRVDRGERPGVRCLAESGGAWLVVADVGAGRVVATGGASAFTNELLATAGNATFALRAVGWPQATAVVVGNPVPASAEPAGPLDALPGGIVAALLGGLIALVAFAFARGRRLGMPRPEDADSPRPVSELIDATGDLYRGAGARAHVARLLRDSVARRLRRALGLPADVGVDELASLASRYAGVDTDRLRRLLSGPAPADEERLLTLARALEDAAGSVERGGRLPPGDQDRSHDPAGAAHGPADDSGRIHA